MSRWTRNRTLCGVFAGLSFAVGVGCTWEGEYILSAAMLLIGIDWATSPSRGRNE